MTDILPLKMSYYVCKEKFLTMLQFLNSEGELTVCLLFECGPISLTHPIYIKVIIVMLVLIDCLLSFRKRNLEIAT